MANAHATHSSNAGADWFKVIENWTEANFRDLLVATSLSPLALFSLAMTVLVVLPTLLIFFLLRRKDKRNGIMLLGLSGSGKTSLFYLLRDGEVYPVLSSIKENEGTFFFKGGNDRNHTNPVHLIDYPGHSRLRPRINHFLPITRAIVFMCDAVDFLKEKHLVAEFLYELLTNKTVNKTDIPILIVANKSDLLTASKIDEIKSQLEQEINSLRSTRDSRIDDDQESITLGIEGENIKLDQLQVDIKWAANVSVKNNDGVEQISSFIRSYIK
eukprot:TRINITY_DN3097_c0_g1_i2.p1 TRINITY_DN3097_c0_g1~~TRINITY_DN3097_c0_g1_i2.p1  ORF type:complete len:271 (-),score=80.07 TRINITY_DN3097_c0_g1_i2:128-940(-)